MGCCFVDPPVLLPQGTAVNVRINKEGQSFEAEGRATYSYPSIGNGIAFISMTLENQQILEHASRAFSEVLIRWRLPLRAENLLHAPDVAVRIFIALADVGFTRKSYCKPLAGCFTVATNAVFGFTRNAGRNPDPDRVVAYGNPRGGISAGGWLTDYRPSRMRGGTYITS